MSDQADFCADIVKRHDYDRWLAALFAPEAARPGILALDAFNLEVARSPEAVSEPLLGEIRLQWWRETVEGAYAGTPRAQPIAEALALAIASHGLSRALFDRLIDARARDLYPEAPATLAALETYAAETAGTLSELTAECLGELAEPSRAAARHVGTGWALVGLVRAVPFHAAHGRVYLPLDLLAAAGLTAEGVLAEPRNPALVGVLARVGVAAAEQFTAARRLRRRVEPQVRPALLPAVLGDFYLRRLARAGWDPAAAMATPSGPAKQLRLAAKALLRRF